VFLHVIFLHLHAHNININIYLFICTCIHINVHVLQFPVSSNVSDITLQEGNIQLKF